MSKPGPRYGKEEFARRGDAIYDRDIGPRVGPEDEGKFVVIDIETGPYEIDRDELAVSDRLLAHRFYRSCFFPTTSSKVQNTSQNNQRKLI